MLKYEPDEVFDALGRAVGRKNDLKIESRNRQLRRLTATGKASMASWGELLTFTVEAEGDGARLRMTSVAKVGGNLASRKRHSEHFETVLTYLVEELEAEPDPDVLPPAHLAQEPRQETATYREIPGEKSERPKGPIYGYVDKPDGESGPNFAMIGAAVAALVLAFALGFLAGQEQGASAACADEQVCLGR